jgi:hypothetical protein
MHAKLIALQSLKEQWFIRRSIQLLFSLLFTLNSYSQVDLKTKKEGKKYLTYEAESSFYKTPVYETKSENTRSLTDAVINELHPQTNDILKQYGVIMLNNTMMSVQNGYITRMKTTTILDDGSKITPLGILIKRNGAKILLKEGDFIDISGGLILTRSRGNN